MSYESRAAEVTQSRGAAMFETANAVGASSLIGPLSVERIMSRLTARKTPLDLVTLDRSPDVSSPARRHATTHDLAPPFMRTDGVGRDGSLDAARGIAVGGVLGALCWLLVGVGVYLIVR